MRPAYWGPDDADERLKRKRDALMRQSATDKPAESVRAQEGVKPYIDTDKVRRHIDLHGPFWEEEFPKTFTGGAFKGLIYPESPIPAPTAGFRCMVDDVADMLSKHLNPLGYREDTSARRNNSNPINYEYVFRQCILANAHTISIIISQQSQCVFRGDIRAFDNNKVPSHITSTYGSTLSDCCNKVGHLIKYNIATALTP